MNTITFDETGNEKLDASLTALTEGLASEGLSDGKIMGITEFVRRCDATFLLQKLTTPDGWGDRDNGPEKFTPAQRLKILTAVGFDGRDKADGYDPKDYDKLSEESKARVDNAVKGLPGNIDYPTTEAV